MAAALAGRGHQVIADDVSFLKRSDANHVLLWPGIGQIRLWEDALTELGFDPQSVSREVRAYDKFLLPVSTPKDVHAPRSLSRIYRLSRIRPGRKKSIKRIPGALAIEPMLQNVYRFSMAERMGQRPAVFEFCADVAARVPIYDFNRPIEFGTLAGRA